MFRRRPFAAALTLALVAPVTAFATSPAASAAPTPTAKKVVAKHLPRPSRTGGHTRAHDPHTVLVKFKTTASKASRDLALTRRGGHAGAQVGGTSFVKVTTNGRAEELASRLGADPSVAEVTLDYVRSAAATPNDPAFGYDQDYLKTVRVPTAWDRSKGSLTQVVAVIDTGVNGKHPDLVGRTVAGYNAIRNVGIAAGAASDDNGHGSMVSGIIAAATNNGVGISGVAWNAKIMPVKVLDGTGNGTDSDVAEGVNWAVSHGAKILNLSLGGDGDNPALHDAVKNAVAKGAVVIVAAGNWGDDVPQYPAAYPEAIAVGATDSTGALTDFSSYGPWIDVAAPGWGILSTRLADTYYFGDGTSFSAPIVAGVATLIRTQSPTLTPAQVLSRLRSTARDAGPRGIDPYYGAGVVDATNALGGGWAADFAQPAPWIGEPNDVPVRAKTLDQANYGLIDVEGDVDWYRFTPTALRAASVTVGPSYNNADDAQNLDPVLAVYDKNLRLVGQVDAKGPGESETLTFRPSGDEYFFTVRNFNGNRTDASYVVGVDSAPIGEFDPSVLFPVASVAGGNAALGATAVGDLTGDGRVDAVATAAAPGTGAQLYVFAQTSSGTFGAARPYGTVDSSLAHNVVVADVDRDGRRDVVVATDLGVQVLLQTAAGDLAPATLVPGTSGVTFVETADLDGDGRTDLVTSSPAGVTALVQQVDGSWAATVVSDTHATELETGDLDGDARPDVAAVAADGVRVLHNTTTGWTSTTHVAVAGAVHRGIEVADVNGDSRADLVVSTGEVAPSSQIVVLTQTSTGQLADPVVRSTTDWPTSVESGDVDGNGRPDVIALHEKWGHVTVEFQGQDGTLGATGYGQTDTVQDFGPGALAVGDVTGDGSPDAVVATDSGLRLVRNGGASTPGTTQLWVRSTSPNDFGSGLTQTYTPTVTFARDVVPSSVTTSTVRILNGRNGSAVPASVTYDAVKRTATVRPTSPLYDNAPYRLTVSGVKDTSATTMTTAYSSTFRTVDVAPKGVGAFRATGALRAATLTWTAPAVNDLDRYIVRMATGSTPPANVTTGTGVYSGTALSAKVNLAQGTTYSFRIWAKDRSGRYSPASSVKLVGTAETIGSSTTSLTKGRFVTVSSKLTRRDTGGPISGVPVQLYWRKVGSTTWNLTATRTSSSVGTVSYAHAPSASVDYMWVYRGSSAYVGSSSALRRVTVR